MKTAYLWIKSTHNLIENKTYYGVHGYIAEDSDKPYSASAGVIFSTMGYIARKEFLVHQESYNHAIKGPILGEDRLPNPIITTALASTGIRPNHSTGVHALHLSTPLFYLDMASSYQHTEKTSADESVSWVVEQVIRSIYDKVDAIRFFVTNSKVVMMLSAGSMTDIPESKELSLDGVLMEKIDTPQNGPAMAELLEKLSYQEEHHAITPVGKPLAANQYWSPKHSIDPLLSMKYIVFLTDHPRPEYFGVECKRTFDMGKRGSLTGYSVVRKNKPIVPVNEYIERVVAHDPNEIIPAYVLNSNVMGAISVYAERYGLSVYKRDPDRSLYRFIGDNRIVGDEYRPVGLCFRGIEYLRILSKIMNGFIKGQYDTVSMGSVDQYECGAKDVTKWIFNTDAKGNVSLRKEIVVGTNMISMPPALGDGREMPYSLGKDLPNRNALNKLKGAVKVYLVHFKERGTNIVRYANIVVTPDGTGIYSNWCCNVAFQNS